MNVTNPFRFQDTLKIPLDNFTLPSFKLPTLNFFLPADNYQLFPHKIPIEHPNFKQLFASSIDHHLKVPNVPQITHKFIKEVKGPFMFHPAQFKFPHLEQPTLKNASMIGALAIERIRDQIMPDLDKVSLLPPSSSFFQRNLEKVASTSITWPPLSPPHPVTPHKETFFDKMIDINNLIIEENQTSLKPEPLSYPPILEYDLTFRGANQFTKEYAPLLQPRSDIINNSFLPPLKITIKSFEKAASYILNLLDLKITAEISENSQESQILYNQFGKFSFTKAVLAGLHRVQAIPKLPDSFKQKVSLIAQQIGTIYNPDIQERLDPDDFSAYFFFDRDACFTTVFNELRGLPISLGPAVRRERIRKRVVELSPVHPAVKEFISPEIIRTKETALALSKTVDSLYLMVSFLKEHGKFHSLKCAPLLAQALKGEPIDQNATWLQETLEELCKEALFKDRELNSKLEELQSNIQTGMTLYQERLKELSLGPQHWKDFGWMILGPAFKVKKSFEILSSKALKNPTDWEAVEKGPIKLKKYPLFESMAARVFSATFNHFDFDTFKASDFYSPSMLQIVDGYDLKGGAIFHVNGIRNGKHESQKMAAKISQMAGGAKVFSTYNATHGSLMDINEALLNFKGVATPPVEVLTQDILNYFEKNGCDKRLLLFCHSQGTAITRNALLQLPPNLRKRISVVAISPSAYIDKELCGNIKHFVSSKDWLVPNLDVEGRKRCSSTITILKSKKKISLCDHGINSPTFHKTINDNIGQFVKENL